MTIYDISVLGAAAGFVLVDIIKIGFVLNIKRKPFMCEVCMSGWVALLLCLITSYYWQALFVMCLSMSVSVLFKKVINYLSSKESFTK